MKAIILPQQGGIENFKWADDFPEPAIQDSQVMVKITASSFNPIDYQIRQGRYTLPSPILGREFAGTVEKIGKGVTKFKKGDQVMAVSGSMGSNGTYAEFITVPENLLILKPENWSAQQAAAFSLVGLTAYKCYLKIIKFHQKTHSLLVTGATGGVGQVLIKLLVAASFSNIIVTVGNEDGKKIMLSYGLKEENIINYKKEELEQHILKANHQQRITLAVDIVGGQLSETCANVLEVEGIYIDVTDLITAQAKTTLFDWSATEIHISNYAYSLKKDYQQYATQLKELTGLFEQYNIELSPVHVIGNLSVETVRKAHTLLEANQTNGKKLVMNHQYKNDQTKNNTK